ncbi:MAG: hypothetical protein RLZZ231_415 [Bacteroidota bacterium]
MKVIKLIPILGCVLILNTASTCSNDDNSSSSNQTQVTNTVVSGTWKITLYNDSGTVKTTNFSGYNFTFGANNALVASNTTNNYTGTWSVTDSNSNDDSLSDLDFNIAFTTPANFQDLTDDWDIVSRTDNKIELIDVSGGNGGTDYLTFEKN